MVGFFSFSLGKGSKMRGILGKPKLKEKRRKKGIYSVFQELSPPLEMVDDIKQTQRDKSLLALAYFFVLNKIHGFAVKLAPYDLREIS